jgi:mediator of RNA polymerase II transcription subunit 7
MADQQEQDPNEVSEIYPEPPAFWKDFTPDNVARYAAVKKAYAKEQKVSVKSVSRVPNVPPELTYLNPPAEPEEGTWNVFAEQLQVSGSRVVSRGGASSNSGAP